MKTRVTEMLGIRYPIIMGGLQYLGRADLAAAVSEAGGLGMITAGSFKDGESFRQELRRMRTLTSKPFGVNIYLGLRRPMDEFFTVAASEEVPAVFTSGRNPEGLVEPILHTGARWFHVVTNVRHAQKAVSLGAHGIVIVTFEAAGHIGMDDIGAMALIPSIVESVSVPVVAAGGIVDGRRLVAALALGAEGVQMGTRFVATRECIAHPNIKQAFLQASERDTVVVKRSIGKAERVYHTQAADQVLYLERQGATVDELMPYIAGEAYVRAVTTGDINAGVIAMGQGVSWVRTILPAEQVVANVIQEADKVLTELNAGIRG